MHPEEVEAAFAKMNNCPLPGDNPKAFAGRGISSSLSASSQCPQCLGTHTRDFHAREQALSLGAAVPTG